MKTLIIWIILFLNANGYPIKSEKRENRSNGPRAQRESMGENSTEISKQNSDFDKHFLGSNLFDSFRKTCFSYEDVNLLIARRDFEMMIPQDLPQDLLDDKSIADIVRYFYYGLWLLRRIEDCNVRRLMERAFYDTLGGFLNYYLVPVAKFSYYASKVELKTVRNVLALAHKCRIFLNTNGNGWRTPIKDPTAEFQNIHIVPLDLDEGREAGNDDRKYCTDLDLSSAKTGLEIVDDKMIVSLPRVELEDSEGYLNNIWMPFSHKRTYNLRSCKSAFIFVRFYRSVSNCYEQKKLERKCFDRQFRQWIVQNIRIHLSDDVFYPGLGGILNVYENLRSVGNKNLNKTIENRVIREENDKDKDDDASLIEEKSCAYANIIEGNDQKLKKRAITNEETNYLSPVWDNMPLGKEDLDWWSTVSCDISTLRPYLKATTAIPNRFKEPCNQPTTQTPVSENPTVFVFETLSTTVATTTEDEFIGCDNSSDYDQTTTARPEIESIEPSTKADSSKKTCTTTSKPPECLSKMEKDFICPHDSGQWFKCCSCFFIIFLILWLCWLCTVFCQKYGGRCKEILQSMTSSNTEVDSKPTKGKKTPPPSGKKSAKSEKSEKKSTKSDKSDKKTTKSEKSDKKSVKSTKTDKKSNKSDKKLKKDEEKSRKKALKDAKNIEKSAKTTVRSRQRGGTQPMIVVATKPNFWSTSPATT